MGLFAAGAPSGGGACKNSVTSADAKISASDRRSVLVSACKVVFRQSFHRNVDWREALLLVCSSAGIEVAGKSR